MQNSPTDLLDASVWIALSDADHVHYVRATRYWLDEAHGQIAFCSITALALLRMTTNRHVMSGRPFSPVQAWANYRRFRTQPHVVMLSEPAGFEAKMAEWSDSDQFSADRWTDCAIAAWADLNACRVVSFDSDFRTFPGLDFLHLQAT